MTTQQNIQAPKLYFATNKTAIKCDLSDILRINQCFSVWMSPKFPKQNSQ